MKHFLISQEVERSYNIFVFILFFYLIGSWFYKSTDLQLRAYNNFSVYASDDLGTQNQVIWNTAYGRLFQFNDITSTDAILSYKNLSILVSHWYIIYLVFSLFYFILPHSSYLIVIQSLLLVLSSLGVYLVAREILSEKKILPLLVFLIYTQYYPLICISYTPLTEKNSLFSLIFLIYFYLKGNFKLSLLFAVLSIFVREENALAISILGIISYFQPQKRKYFLPFLLGGILWYVFTRFTTCVVLNAPLRYHHFARQYSYLGQAFLEKIKNIFFNPSLPLNNILRPEKISLFKEVFGSLLYLPFISPILFAPGLIMLAGVMLSQSVYIGSLRWQPWYLSFFIPFIFMALAGAFEKIYQMDKFLIKIFAKHNFIYKKNSRNFIKAISLILIFILFSYIYSVNSHKTRLNNNQFKDFLKIERYWNTDTLGVISAIKKDAKVACSFKLLPMLSCREYVLTLHYLIREIIDKGVYDIILISEDDWNDNMNKYVYMKQSPLYRQIYYTPYLKVFVRNGISSSSLIDNWKFDLLSKMKDSSITHNYIFSDFREYTTILENADMLDYARLIDNIYSRKDMHYDVLWPIKQTKDAGALVFPLHKPLEKGCDYLLAFAITANNALGNIFLKTPNGQFIDIKVDNRLRLFVLPLKVNSLLEKSSMLVQADCSYYMSNPVIIKITIDESFLSRLQDIFSMDIAGKTFSFNPYLNKADFFSRDKHFQFLAQDKGIYMNPMFLFMKLFNFPIPQDLLTYSWKDKIKNNNNKIIAVRY